MKYKIRNIVMFLLILLGIELTVYFYLPIFMNKKKELNYTNAASVVDYKVFYKENDFFEEKYLGSGKTYLTNLIEKIDTTYSYNMRFSNQVSGTYKYKLIAEVKANLESDSAELLTRKYDLTEYETENINKKTQVTLLKEYSIDYNRFNKFFNEFKKTNSEVNVLGNLNVYLEVVYNVKNNTFKNINFTDKIGVNIPLSNSAVQARIETVNNGTNNTLIYEKKKLSSYKDNIFLGTSLLTVSILLLIVNTLLNKKYKEKNKFKLELETILNSYDSVIVTVNTLPDLEEKRLINVASFEELMDAHSEIRLPINYYKYNNLAIFFLIKDDMVWKYVLRGSDTNEK